MDQIQPIRIGIGTSGEKMALALNGNFSHNVDGSNGDEFAE